jgi:hypothetical protein
LTELQDRGDVAAGVNPVDTVTGVNHGGPPPPMKMLVAEGTVRSSRDSSQSCLVRCFRPDILRAEETRPCPWCERRNNRVIVERGFTVCSFIGLRTARRNPFRRADRAPGRSRAGAASACEARHTGQLENKSKVAGQTENGGHRARLRCLAGPNQDETRTGLVF